MNFNPGDLLITNKSVTDDNDYCVGYVIHVGRGKKAKYVTLMCWVQSEEIWERYSISASELHAYCDPKSYKRPWNHYPVYNI